MEVDPGSKTVHIGNLDVTMTEAHVKAFFEMHCGTVIRINLMTPNEGQAVRHVSYNVFFVFCVC